jgi:hypothetical protein
MGGLGSGREGWLPTIEHGLTLDLRHLRQDGLFDGISALRSITLAWSNPRTNKQTASVAMSYSATSRDSWLKLEYTVTRDNEHISVKDTFRLERLAQPFGGHRWYFLCRRQATAASAFTFHQVPRTSAPGKASAAGCNTARSIMDRLTAFSIAAPASLPRCYKRVRRSGARSIGTRTLRRNRSGCARAPMTGFLQNGQDMTLRLKAILQASGNSLEG